MGSGLAPFMSERKTFFKTSWEMLEFQGELGPRGLKVWVSGPTPFYAALFFIMFLNFFMGRLIPNLAVWKLFKSTVVQTHRTDMGRCLAMRCLLVAPENGLQQPDESRRLSGRGILVLKFGTQARIFVAPEH